MDRQQQHRSGCPDLAELLGQDEAVRDHLRICPSCVERMRRCERLESLVRRSALAAPAKERSDCPPPDRLARYIEGFLDDAERESLEQHLAFCVECRRTILHASAALQASMDGRVNPDDVVLRLIPEIAGKKSSSFVRRRRRDTRRHSVLVVRRSSLLPWAVAAAAVVLIVILLAISGKQTPQGRSSNEEKKSTPEIAEKPKETPEVREQHADVPRQPTPERPAPERTPPSPVRTPPVVDRNDRIETPPILPKEPTPEKPPQVVETIPPGGETAPTVPSKPEKRIVAVIDKIDGSVTIDGKPAAAGDAVPEGSEIVTAEKSVAVFKFDNGSQLFVNKVTTLSWASADRVSLKKGEIFARIVPRKSPFAVRTDHGEITVKGTEFDVRTDDRQTAVATVTGEVECANVHGTVAVSSLRQTSMNKDRAPSTVKSFKPADLLAWTRGLQQEFFIKRIETFDGNKMNATLWEEADKGNCLRQEGRIVIKGDAARRADTEMPALIGRFAVAGDFDLQIDYRLPTMELRPGASVDCTASGLFLTILYEQQSLTFRIGARWFGDRWILEAKMEKDNAWQGMNVPTDRPVPTEGRFRIARNANLLQGFIEWEGKWVPLAEYAAAPAGAIRVAVVGCADDSAKIVEIDNIAIPKGTFVLKSEGSK